MQKCALNLYLSRLSPNSSRSIQSQLITIGRILDWPDSQIPERIQKIDYFSALNCRSIMIARGYSARSINRSMIALKGLLKVSVLLGNIDQTQLLQVQSIPNLKQNEHKGSPLTSEQVNLLFSQLNQAKSELEIRNAAIATLFLATGLRRSELVSLKFSDYNREDKTVFVAKGKGNKSRTAFLPSWCCDYLNHWIEIRGTQNGYLFCNLKCISGTNITVDIGINQKNLNYPTTFKGLNLIPRNQNLGKKSPLDGSTAYRIIKDMTSQIGLLDVSPHDFRRTFITRLLELNVDLNTVRQMAGHASISTTTLYDKRDKRFMQQAANRLNFTE